VTFDSVLAQYGVPYYLKIDIERASRHCLQALSPPDVPPYISIEAHTVAYLGMLSMLGYDEFKLVDQRTHLAIDRYRPGSVLRLRVAGWQDHAYRVRAQTERVALLVPGARHTYRALFNVTSVGAEPDSLTPRLGASGPFAEDIDGNWRALDEVAFDYLRLRSPHNPSWYDFHARISRRD
jgi:hypothetical protein